MSVADDVREIGDLIARYALALDRRDWDAFPGIFAADAIAYDETCVGPEAIAALNRQRLADAGATMHFLGHQTISVDGDQAKAVSQIRVYRVGSGAHADKTYEVMGEYHDELVRTEAGWRIRRRQFDRRIFVGVPDWL